MTTLDLILDLLLDREAIIKENCDNVRSQPTNQARMRELYNLMTTRKSKDIFYRGLETYEKCLLEEL